MKEKTKEFLKKYLIGFILGFVSVGIVVVYAETYFPSNDVTYDNTESGLSSTNVQGAIDELYGVCTAEPPAGDQIIEDAGLEKDPYECRYFFTGGDPNNYMTFNDEKAGWRIISVECDGTIKIMRINSIGTVTVNNNDLSVQVNDENAVKWNGKIALSTVSEYLRTNSNLSCKTFRSYNDNYNTCKNTTWMFSSNDWWTLSAFNSYTSFVFRLISNGALIYYDYTDAGSYQPVFPSVYLSADVTLSGSGTQSDPYVVSS